MRSIMFCSNAEGDESVAVYSRDVRKNRPSWICCAVCRSAVMHPLTVPMFPDDKHLAVINNHAKPTLIAFTTRVDVMRKSC
ncbi:MAG: hypothetical protein ACLUD2_02420 [Clostridium sp.]